MYTSRFIFPHMVSLTSLSPPSFSLFSSYIIHAICESIMCMREREEQKRGKKATPKLCFHKSLIAKNKNKRTSS